jgi:transcriptional regulator with XRE-family HTH domain
MNKQIQHNSVSQHTSVADMVRTLSDDRAFTEEFEKKMRQRQFIKLLTILRTRADLSQENLAQKLGCTQGKVSKLEHSDDKDIRFGDLLDYTEAVGCEMRIMLVPKGQKIVDEVKFHAFIIKRLLDRLVHLARNDGALVEATTDFLEEAAFNLMRYVQKAAAALPPVAEEGPRPLQVEALELEEEQLAERIRPEARSSEEKEEASASSR